MLPGPLSILLDSPVLLDMSWLQIFMTTLECLAPCSDGGVGEALLEYTCDKWSQVAEERTDAEQALFLRDALIIEMLTDSPVRGEYFSGMRMRFQIQFAMLEMQGLAFGSIGCEGCRF